MPRRIKTHSRSSSSSSFRFTATLILALLCLVHFWVTNESAADLTTTPWLLLRSTTSQSASSAAGTVVPTPLSTPSTDRVFRYPQTLELSTEGVLADGVLATEFSGSFRYAYKDEMMVHFPPVTSQSDFLLLTKAGDKSSATSSIYMDWDLPKPPPLPNQDRSVLIHHANSLGSNHSHKLLTLLDGHGTIGHYASQAVVLDLPFQLWGQLEYLHKQERASSDHIHKVMRTVFLNVDRGVVSRVSEGGTTAVVVYQNDNTVYLASAGDSTAFCAIYKGQDEISTSNNPSTILLRAIQHKPGDPRERARIEGEGGTVLIPSKWEQANGASSRVLIPSADGMSSTALAMSRCLGDEEGKQLKVLSAEPSIVEHAIQTNMFCVAASDGLVDFVPADEVANVLGKALYEDGGSDLASVSQELIEASVRQWAISTGGTYRDDISLAVVRIS